MDLLTHTLRERLLFAGACHADQAPLVKYFNPIGAATGLLTKMSSGDVLCGRITEYADHVARANDSGGSR